MFIGNESRFQLPGSGRKESKIAIVGDFTDGFDINARRPFSGIGGQVLESCLHTAGLIRSECYLTNLVKEKGNPDHFYSKTKKRLTDRGLEYAEILKEELADVEANIIVPAGDAALLAVAGLPHLTRYRGYVFDSDLLPGRKVIPILSPRQAVRGMYTYRYMIAADLRKVKYESEFPEIRRPERRLIWQYGSIYDALEWLHYFEDQPQVGFDIEVLNYEVSCISMASSPDLACVFPTDSRWTLDEAVPLWRGIQAILGNPKSTKIIQNSMFDVPFLLTRNGIVVRGPIHDTMVGHSILYPELQKSLGFLGSIYCGSQEYWKDTVKFKSIKDED